LLGVHWRLSLYVRLCACASMGRCVGVCVRPCWPLCRPVCLDGLLQGRVGEVCVGMVVYTCSRANVPTLRCRTGAIAALQASAMHTIIPTTYLCIKEVMCCKFRGLVLHDMNRRTAHCSTGRTQCLSVCMLQVVCVSGVCVAVYSVSDTRGGGGSKWTGPSNLLVMQLLVGLAASDGPLGPSA
jgi:hypothetical protein